MDVSLSQSIVSTATALAGRQTADAVNVAVLKKALDIQAAGAATLLQSVAPAPQPALATSGPLGTQINTFA
ncbi:YjfB family protein [Acidovorax sp. FG27]|uniref:YjfB family protein n=1 Tax=Acidovorax sp. FG27 TaxID=3133652 RepID=UPI0030EA7889